MSGSADARPSAGERVRGYAVHLYTASGIVLAALAAAEIFAVRPDPRIVFALFAAATVVDATDGFLARRWQVKRTAPEIDGRTIDDIVDYITFTFLPLLLVWRMEWVPDPALLWIAPAMIASLFGFANAGAKDESGGFFRGFPSYWNVVAFYAGLLHPLLSALLIVALAALTVLPVRFIYPTLAPRPWRVPLLLGAFAWLALMLAMLPEYPDVAPWLLWLSLSYPLLYTLLSWQLSRRNRRMRSAVHPQ
ncbi:MAG: phosphatidylcholine synthase [Gemmatimonadetes bacterium]|nr:phosphatidylcholine synthase [Gemmatimonadota bacterium]